MRSAPWVEGNAVRLLENGEEFFPRVFEAIARAQHEVLIETFILFEDKVGMALQAVLRDAADRGVQIDMTVDGWGSCDLSEAFISTLAEHGARVHRVDHQRRIFGFRSNLFRRLHRKLVVIDGCLGFIGGINFAEDHLTSGRPKSKQDYAAEVQGPIVAHMHRFMLTALGRPPAPMPAARWWQRLLGRGAPGVPAAHAGSARAMLVWRDNNRHRDDIERHYRAAIRAARERVVLANAYFLPGLRLLRQIAHAARRGVQVDLIVQGRPDMAMAVWGSTAVYAYLIRAGVRIHEFCERPLHGKVALMDHEWATIGSSNLDPFSLALNLEANLFLLDAGFNAELSRRLEGLIQHSCREVVASRARLTLISGLFATLLFHCLRWFPRMGQALPPHVPRVEQAPVAPTDDHAAAEARRALP